MRSSPKSASKRSTRPARTQKQKSRKTAKSDNQKAKSKLRRSSEWKKLRSRLKRDRKRDELTLSPLRPGFSVHHLDLNADHYGCLDDESRFAVLNKKSHDCIHFLYSYWLDDHEIIDRLTQILERMKQINND